MPGAELSNKIANVAIWLAVYGDANGLEGWSEPVTGSR
jgi:hypothetical protein